ncbi:hypothetical protein [Roseomonas indoligenes]|uniref:Uncharacterized protein n=1 Tax=Roseomonas indoligenes TaxID=2820811 RepID=A0A940S7F3_9PROT|nr:hypothetical protein [Pararoseomonas indoligenes]MBP0493003.1 hypothetical protein [Pararoseomonas indoligenes]
MPDLPTLFADGVTEATVRHGVARLTLAVQDGKGQPLQTGILVVPLTQLPAVVGAMTRLLREVEAKSREATAAPQLPAAPAVEAEPETFRFQG